MKCGVFRVVVLEIMDQIENINFVKTFCLHSFISVFFIHHFLIKILN